MSNKMKTRKNKERTLKSVLMIIPVINQDKFTASLERLTKPKALCGVPVPDDLNGITYGKLCALSYTGQKPEDAIFKVCNILLDIEKERLLQAPANDVFGFIRFVGDEVKRINKMFDDIAIEPTPEQIQAGANNLKFGAFGTLDWYARRMGITDHDEVMKTPWGRIYQCVKMDNEIYNYERRLNKIYEQKAKAARR